MESEQLICSDCKEELDNLKDDCPFCNSTKKILKLDLEDILDIHEAIADKTIAPNLNRKKRVRKEFFQGDDRSKNGDWAYKIRIIDRDNNYYFEKVRKQGEKMNEKKGQFAYLSIIIRLLDWRIKKKKK